MKIFFLVSFLCIALFSKSQNYQISFSGSGEVDIVETVQVFHAGRDTTLYLDGSDTLHLRVVSNIESLIGSNSYINAYPNPAKGNTNLEFYSDVTDDFSLELYNVSGIKLLKRDYFLHEGYHSFSLSGLKSGAYFVKLSSNKFSNTKRIISTGGSSMNYTIEYGGKVLEKPKTKTKLQKNIIEIDYDEGDALVFKGVSGDHTSIVRLIPEYSQVLDFKFLNCEDAEGNNYSIVTIGNQVWMAENLRYLPSVSSPETASDTIPLYYVNEYYGTDVNEAKNTPAYTTYGVLYNLPAALNACPEGWRLPSHNDWSILEQEICNSSNCQSTFPLDNFTWGYGGKNEGSAIAGNKELWSFGNLVSNNEFGSSGFNALPGGARFDNGDFHSLGNTSNFWSSTVGSIGFSWQRKLSYNYAGTIRYSTANNWGFSVRCIKDM